MASKVNTKFVFGLSGALILIVAGVSALLFYSNMKSASRNIARAEAFVAEAESFRQQGDMDAYYESLTDAAQQYGNAVNKESGDFELLETWVSTLERTRPATDAEYEKLFEELRAGIARMARLQPANPAAKLREIEFEFEFITRQATGSTADAPLARVIDDITSSLPLLPADQPETKKLRGYRGLAQLQRMYVTQIDEELTTQALEDLQIAAEAFPEHDEFTHGVPAWYQGMSFQYELQSRQRLAEESRERSLEEFRSLIERDPTNLRAQATMLNINIREAASDPSIPRREIAELAREVRADFAQRILNAPAEEIDWRALVWFVSLNSLPLSDTEELKAIFEHARSAHPESPEHYILPGRHLTLAGQFDSAIESLELLTDTEALERPELSIEGYIFPQARLSALFDIADAALTKAERSISTSPVVTEVIEQLTGEGGVRARIADLAGVTNQSRLKLIDGRVALLEGKPREANAMLSEARNELGDQPIILYYIATSNSRIGNVGVAKEMFERIFETEAFRSQPTRRYLATLEYAGTLTATGEYDQAATLLDELSTTFGDLAAISQFKENNNVRYIASLRTARVRLDGEIDRLTTEIAAAPANSTEQRRLQRLLLDSEQQLDQITTVLNSLGSDPVADAIEQARKLQINDDVEGALALTRSMLSENPEDPRLYALEIQCLDALGLRAEAVAKAEQAQQKFPELPRFAEYVARLQTNDPVQFALDQIDADTSITEAQRSLQKSQIYRTIGNDEKAEEMLAQAVSIDSSDPAIVEFTFANALAASDFDEARRIADIAAAENVDQLNGLSFEGRIRLVEGNLPEAVRLFEEAAERLPTDPSVARFLARAYQRSGQITLATEALKNAYDGRPTDPVIAREYAIILRDQGNIQAALDVVGPDSQVAGQLNRDSALRDVYLSLIAIQGNTGRAIDTRLQTFQSNPTDGGNSIALLELLVNASRYKDARDVIASIRSNPIAVAAVEERTPSRSADVLFAIVEAQMLVRTNQQDQAKALVLSSLQEGSSGNGSSEAVLAVARFLLGMQVEGWVDAGLELLSENRSLQSDSAKEIDAMISRQGVALANFAQSRADFADRTGNVEAAAELRERTASYLQLAADALVSLESATDETRVNKNATLVRLAEVRSLQDNQTEANQIIGRVLSDEPNNLDALLMAAQLATDDGDTEQARRHLDAAVTSHQDQHNAYLARAILNSSESRLKPDVLQDLDVVHRLAPELALAWQLRFQIATDSTEVEQAIARLRAAIDESPASASQLVDILIGQLNSIGRVDEGATAAAEQADLDPTVARWQAVAANLLVNVQRYTDAITYYQRLISIADNRGLPEAKAQAAIGILNAQIRGEINTQAGETQRLVRVADEGLPERSVQGDMILARAMIDSGDRTDGLRRIRATYDRSAESSQLLTEFMRELNFGLGSNEEARQYTDFLLGQSQSPPLIVQVASVNNKLGSGLLNQQTLSEGEAVLSNARAQGDQLAEFEILKTLSRMTYGLTDFQSSEEYARAALDIFPQAIDINNDLAFVLAKHLGRVEEAIPFAERALASNPTDANILDTIGFVFLESGRNEDAIRTLNRAVAAARTDTERVPANVHLAQAYLAAGERGRAEGHLERAERALRGASAIVQNTYSEDVIKLRLELENAG